MRNLYICTWNLRALKIFGTVQKIIRLEIYAFPKLYVSIRLIFPKTFRTPEVINFSNWTREVILPVERENLCEFLEILTFFRFMILFRSTKNINTYLIPWKLEYTLGNQFGMLNNYACLVYKLLLTAECITSIPWTKNLPSYFVVHDTFHKFCTSNIKKPCYQTWKFTSIFLYI